MTPYYRFVEPHMHGDPAARRPGLWVKHRLAGAVPAYYPTATINDDTRYVLFAPVEQTLPAPQQFTVPADGRLTFFPEVPPTLAQAKRILLFPNIEVRGIWHALPMVTFDPRQNQGRPLVDLTGALSQAEVGAVVTVRVDGMGVMTGGVTSWSTAEVRIPYGARLDFAIGILEAARTQGPVVFEVQACTGDDCNTLFTETVDPGAASGRGWFNRTISLHHLAWRRRTFRFQTKSQREDAAYSAPAWGNPTVYGPAVRGKDDTNIILLSIDTLAAQHLKTYGYQHDTAPFIEETFGKHGTVFAHCVAAAATTPPSHMTMFTSVQPCVHGLTTGTEGLPSWLVTLAETLRGSGFETAAVTEDGWLSGANGFGRGFNSYVENKSANLMAPEGQVDVTFGKAREWLAGHRDQRFFLFLHTFQVHDPYAPPPEYRDRFTRFNGEPVTATSPPQLRDRVAYDQEIAYTDDQLRLLFEAIDANGLGHNTIFILLSDHGEEFAEHGVWGHGTQLYEEVTRVPLMFWAPGQIPEGARVSTPVGHIDLMPTILDLAGVPKPAQVMGASFLDLLRGKPMQPRERPPLFSEAWGSISKHPDRSLVHVERPAYLVQKGSRKLSRYRRHDTFVYEYYDIVDDPDERRNLYAAGVPDAADLRQLADGYENACKAAITSLASASQETAMPPASPAHLSPGEQEKLRALGYLH